MKIIRRNHKTELRTQDDESGRIEGISTLFGVESPNYGGIIEITHKGFFDGVTTKDVVAMWEHDSAMPLAAVRNGTLSLDIDDVAVKYGFEATETSYSKDLLINVRSRLVDQSSFGFYVKSQEWEERDDGTLVRHLIKAEKWIDVSPVTHAYYPDTSVVAKSLRSAYNDFLETRPKVSYHWMDLDLKLLKAS